LAKELVAAGYNSRLRKKNDHKERKDKRIGGKICREVLSQIWEKLK